MKDGSEASRRTLRATTVGAYLVSAPESGGPAPLLVGFHGYGENAEACLAELRRIPGSGAWLVVAVEALHRFYAKNRAVVGSWMTSLDREEAITHNVAYVESVLSALLAETATDGRLVYAGFSQGTSMAYRAAARGSRAAQGIIALGGDLPPEVAADSAVVLPPVLIGVGSRDEWYTEEKLAQDVERLRARGAEVEVARFDGGHEWTDEFRKRASLFLRRVAPVR